MKHLGEELIVELGDESVWGYSTSVCLEISIMFKNYDW